MQTFGEGWATTIKDFAPLIQGFTTFLGAALGGVVAMLTTRSVLNGQAAREKEKLLEERRSARATLIREYADRYLTLIAKQQSWEMAETRRFLSFARRFDRGEDVAYKQEDDGLMALSEAKTIEALHLTFMKGHCKKVGAATVAGAAMRVEQLQLLVDKRGEWAHTHQADFLKQFDELGKRMAGVVDEIEGKLREELEKLDG